jgi:hypothetical protein
MKPLLIGMTGKLARTFQDRISSLMYESIYTRLGDVKAKQMALATQVRALTEKNVDKLYIVIYSLAF